MQSLVEVCPVVSPSTTSGFIFKHSRSNTRFFADYQSHLPFLSMQEKQSHFPACSLQCDIHIHSTREETSVRDTDLACFRYFDACVTQTGTCQVRIACNMDNKGRIEDIPTGIICSGYSGIGPGTICSGYS